MNQLRISWSFHHVRVLFPLLNVFADFCGTFVGRPLFEVHGGLQSAGESRRLGGEKKDSGSENSRKNTWLGNSIPCPHDRMRFFLTKIIQAKSFVLVDSTHSTSRDREFEKWGRWLVDWEGVEGFLSGFARVPRSNPPKQVLQMNWAPLQISFKQIVFLHRYCTNLIFVFFD